MKYFNETTFLKFSLINCNHADKDEIKKYNPIIMNINCGSLSSRGFLIVNPIMGNINWTHVRKITPIKPSIVLQNIFWQRLF